MRKFVLIGGAPLAGKTTLAEQFAKTFNGDNFSTDDIRNWIKKKIDPKKAPNLFYDEGLTVEEFYKKYPKPEDVLEGEILQSLEVQKGILEFINSESKAKVVVIEGIAITPRFVHDLEQREKEIESEIISMFIYENNKERIRERIYKRGLWDDADKYDDRYKEMEIEWVVLYNEYFRMEAEKYGYMIIPVDEVPLMIEELKG